MSDEALTVTTTSGVIQGIRLLASGDQHDPELPGKKAARRRKTGAPSGKAPKYSKKINKISKAHLRQRRRILAHAQQLDAAVSVHVAVQPTPPRNAPGDSGGGTWRQEPDEEPYIRTWRGVPYGESTAGEHRFRAPRPYQFRAGVRDCSQFGDAALQPHYGLNEATFGSEDCLNLDIVRPDTDVPLPVVVYFHGGSFFLGASHKQLLRGHKFAVNMNVVYVSVNFRLGALGYLDMRSVGADCVANPALLDQLLALRWVHHNIAAFGGDPENVTLMGESAGAASALTLMCVPAATGLFHKVIAQSPPIAAVHSEAQSAYWARKLCKRLKLGNAPSLQQIRKLPGAEVVRAGQSMMWRAGQIWSLNPSYASTVDHLVLHDHPLAVFRRGQQMKVPLMVGTNVDEVSMVKSLYIRQEARGQAARRILESYDAAHAEQVLTLYDGATTRQGYASLLGDAIFWAPTVRAAQAHAQVAATWMYRFDFAPVAMRLLGLGAVHTTELTPIFGDYGATSLSLTQVGDRRQLEQLGVEMQDYWRRFIWSGNPGGHWPPYQTATDKQPGRATYIFDRDPHLLFDPRASYRKVWDAFDITTWEQQHSSLIRFVKQNLWPAAQPADSTTSNMEEELDGK